MDRGSIQQLLDSIVQSVKSSGFNDRPWNNHQIAIVKTANEVELLLFIDNLLKLKVEPACFIVSYGVYM